MEGFFSQRECINMKQRIISGINSMPEEMFDIL